MVRPPNLPRLLTRRETAALISARYFQLAAQTLARYACRGGGPCYYKAGHRALYAESDVRAWAESRLGGPVRFAREAPAVATARAKNAARSATPCHPE